MPTILVYAFLFCIGSLLGWCIEVVFRRFFSSANPTRRWINPGFLVGPCLPLYGFCLCALYLLASCEPLLPIATPWLKKMVLFIGMALCVTLVEFLTGLFCQKVLKVKLWDYSKRKGNIMGIICPRFTVFWAILSALYYFFIHPHILQALAWLSQNLAFSFVIGMFYGVFALDLAYSIKLLPTIRAFAKEHELVVKYEDLKADVRAYAEKQTGKAKFFLLMHTPRPLKEQLAESAQRIRTFASELHKPRS